MKYTAAIIAGLVVFSGLILSTCEKRSSDVYAVVNGIDIHGHEFLTDDNREDEEKKKVALNAYIEKKVIESEAQKLNTTESDLLGFFDSLKTRDVPANQVEKIFKEEFKDQGLKSREEMLEAVISKQYDLARKTYIFELMSRSTILLVDDDGNYHTYKPTLN